MKDGLSKEKGNTSFLCLFGLNCVNLKINIIKNGGWVMVVEQIIEEIKEENIKKCKVKYIETLDELDRRVNITYRTRINSANRLRENNEKNKKLNIYYSALVTAISVISIGTGSYTEEGSKISLIVLVSSIMLTYYMFYISEQNLQERAYKMEETFKYLDILRNKISFLKSFRESNLTENDCKKVYKEYEQILASIENHKQIDYDIHILRSMEREKETQNEEYKKVKKSVDSYNRIENIKSTLQYIIPGIGSFILILKCLVMK